MDLDPKSRDLAIRTIIGEASDQGPQGQAAVASVIFNRLATGKYGKSVSDVVLAPSQFEPWSTRSKELLAINPNSSTYRNVGDIVDMVNSGDIPDQSRGATHFLNENIVRQRRGGSLPSWASQPVVKIGSHTFYSPQGKVETVDPLDAINRAINGD